MTNPLRDAIARGQQAAATTPPQPEVTLDIAEEAMLQRAARSTAHHKKSNDAGGKALVFHTVRIFPEDMETLEKMSAASLRDKAFLSRMAIHMLCEAYRRNPRLRLTG